MANNINYPVRYVILGLREKHIIRNVTSSEVYYDEEYAYVVVKALVVNEIKTYNPKGGFATSYDVVPEWKQDEYNIEPKFNLYGRCYNTVNVECDRVFTDVESAKRYCKELNNSFLAEKLLNCNPEVISTKKAALKEKMAEAEKLQNEYLKVSKKR